MLQAIAYHFAGGHAFFTGIGAILIGCALARFADATRKRLAARILAIVGFLMVILSATPLPWWFYALWGMAIMAWLIATGAQEKSQRSRSVRVLSPAVAALSLLGLLLELPCYWTPQISGERSAGVAVIGDSIAAGLTGPEEYTWPERLRDTFHVRVADQSGPGATARSALEQARTLTNEDWLVLIEIGGNDLLGGTTSEQFATDLENLLAALQRPNRQLVMLELPLPPFYNKYGRIQRRLARQFDVMLIPRRYFAGVIAAQDATQDGLHLSEKGHQLMAEMVWNQIGSALETSLQ